MVLYLGNGMAAGQAFPATVDEAYIIAKGWKSSSARVTDSRGIAAYEAFFMLANEVRTLAIVPSPTALDYKVSARRPRPSSKAIKVDERRRENGSRSPSKGSHVLQMRRRWARR